LHNQYPNTSFISLKNVHNENDAKRYLGKSVICALSSRKGKKNIVRGKVVRTNGKSGVCRVRIERNLPAEVSAMRVMLYPSSI